MTDYHKVGNRADDASLMWRTSGFISKYKLPLYLLFLILVAFGFNFQTPHMMIMSVRTELVDSLAAVRRDELQLKIREDASYNDRVDQRFMLEALVRVQCSTMSVHEQDRLGLPCAEVLDPTHHHVEAQIRAPGETP